MITLLLGIGSSIVAEAAMWIDKKLSGTVLQGKGAFFLAMAFAFIAAIVKLFILPIAGFQVFMVGFLKVWIVSQAFFLAVIKLFHIDVQPDVQIEG